MAGPPPAAGGVLPAQLSYLTIFNPSLSSGDDTIEDQIVYYASASTQHHRANRKKRSGRRAHADPTEGMTHEERQERLRQIGLAQGMANFSRGFADGAAVDAMDTEKSKVILHELEPGWWILASIDFTRMPLPPRLPTQNGEKQEERYEYSSREMKTHGLLLADLLRAHNIFLMHHDSSLSALFVRCKRSKFVATLHRYWDLFLSTWNVMLHGNPTRDIYGGINIAASGELGVGVGEEDRGSGEREVLEGLVGRIEGLVDLVVSRFGDPEPVADDKKTGEPDAPSQWLGTGREAAAEDGAIFLGTGALSRKSIRDITHWMEDLYTWGDHAYGVIESPTSLRRARTRRHTKATIESLPAPNDKNDKNGTQTAPSTAADDANSAAEAPPQGAFGPMFNYFKMAYNVLPSGIPGRGSVSEPAPAVSALPSRPRLQSRVSSFEASGHFLIGLKGGMEEGLSDHSQDSDENDPDTNTRTSLRTVNIELESEAVDRPETTIVKDFVHPASVLTQSQVMGNMVPGYNSHDLNKAKKVRVVIYVNRPFMFAFLFHLRTDSLAWDSFYRTLHHQLSPLRKPLLASTNYRPHKPKIGPANTPDIYDLVWDPKSLVLRSTIPNIPDSFDPSSAPANPWSHSDALSTHLHILNIHASTRSRPHDTERTQKTTLGWWIVWTRLPERQDETPSHLAKVNSASSEQRWADSVRSRRGSDEAAAIVGREIYLVRRASDHIGFRRDSMAGEGGMTRLAQGIGVDTRRYIEHLLSLL